MFNFDPPVQDIPFRTEYTLNGSPVYAIRVAGGAIASGATLATLPHTCTLITASPADSRCCARILHVRGWTASSGGIKHWVGAGVSAAPPSTCPQIGIYIENNGALRANSAGGTLSCSGYELIVYYAINRQ